jgi:hypothetical protein
MITRPLLLVALCGCVLCECAAAPRWADPPQRAAPSARPSNDDDALRGPTIDRPAERAEHSIVERDFSGRLKKLDDHPVLVALTRLDLTPEQRAAADRVLGDRAAVIDAIVRDNLREIIELDGARKSGDAAAVKKLQTDLLEKARPFFKRGTMLAELMPVLPEDKFTELKKMVEEYNRAAAQDRSNDPMSGKDKPNAIGGLLAQGFENFGAEARASFRRVVEAGGKDFDRLIQMLQLTPEQEGKVRQKAGDLYQKTYGKPTKAQQIRLLLGIYAELDTEQRHRLARYIGEESRERRAAKALTP